MWVLVIHVALIYCLPSSADINIPLFIGLYAFWKLYKKTKVWKPLEMDFVTVRLVFRCNISITELTTRLQGIPSVEETDIPEVPPITVLQKIAAVLF